MIQRYITFGITTGYSWNDFALPMIYFPVYARENLGEWGFIINTILFGIEFSLKIETVIGGE